MKKLLAVVLVLALFSSFAVYSFAAESPSSSSTSSTTPAAFPAQPEEEGGLEIRLLEDDSLVKVIPDEDVTKVDVANADELEDADKEAFLAAYEAVKAVEGKAVKFFFWLDIPEELKETEYAKYDFVCEGENVEVTVNGNPMEVVAGDAENSYTAKLTELGAVAILCDAE